MELYNKIQKLIKDKLFFTNGYFIDEEKYDNLIKELSKEIMIEINNYLGN